MIQPKALASYVDPLSVQAGDTLRVMVSCHASGGYQADLVRLISGDSRPRGTGFIETPIAAQFEGHYEGREQPIAGGSFARLPGLPAVASFTFSALIYPTTPYRDGQVIVANERFRLRIEQAVLVLESGSARLTSTVPVAAMRWHAIELVAANGNVKIALRGFGQGAAERAQRASTVDMPLALEVPAGDWTLAGPGFNGCIEAPRLEDADGTLIAAWDFSRKMATDTIVDTSPHGRHGKLLQTPTRAVKGSRWDGSTQRWADDPSQYAAIHFHEDDLTDAGWKPDIEWRIPDDLPSGQYAVRLRSGEANQKHDGEPVAEHEEDHAVFFVRRAASRVQGAKSAKIAYLAATA
ncbi:MAG: hypothetical protein O7H39_04700, partial [Gammaproteobacteria bacterium]|nr:hypothetical protein [Gammaproteobacteria bacterium]